jgi:ornithine cyclodeaminase
VLVLSRGEVESLLDLDRLIDALADAMADLSAGRASAPNRTAALVPGRSGLLGAMPAHLPSAGALTSKLVTLFPENAGGETPTHQAVIVAFDPDSGTPTAVLDGTVITALRTGACSALSARLLARPDSTTLAILGTGVQARSHARAVVRVRPIDAVRIAGRDPEKAGRLAGELSSALRADVQAVGSYREALAGADIACATTHPSEPVIRRRWVEPGTHITSVGYDPDGREVDDETVADALVYVESRGSALAPAPAGTPDLLEPIERGVIDADHIRAELGEVVADGRLARTSAEQITLYKSVGVAVQDAAATALVLAGARERGVGRQVAL